MPLYTAACTTAESKPESPFAAPRGTGVLGTDPGSSRSFEAAASGFALGRPAGGALGPETAL